MRFTAAQYDEAIKSLTDGKRQLEPDGDPCAVCGDGGHQAMECGFNPLVAMLLCQQIARTADEFHETLHWFAGYDTAFGVQRGPAKVVLPAATEVPS